MYAVTRQGRPQTVLSDAQGALAVTDAPYSVTYYTLLCDEVDDVATDEADIVAAEVYSIVLPRRCVGVNLTLQSLQSITMYNNGTNSYAVFPRCRGVVATVGAEDAVVAAERMNQPDNAPASEVQAEEAAFDTFFVPANETIKVRFNASAADILHAVFLDGDTMFTNTGGAGGPGQVVIGGTPVVNYSPARLHVTAFSL